MKHSATRMRKDDHIEGEKKKGTRAIQKLYRMADGVNITVEAHWRLRRGGEQCDSTNVATGISEHHSASTGVLSSVSAASRRLKGKHSSHPCIYVKSQDCYCHAGH